MSHSDDPVVSAGRQYLQSQQDAQRDLRAQRQAEATRARIAHVQQLQEQQRQREADRQSQRAAAQVMAFARRYVDWLRANHIVPSGYVDKRKQYGAWPLGTCTVQEERASYLGPKMPGDDSDNWGTRIYTVTVTVTVYIAADNELYRQSSSAKTGWERFEAASLLTLETIVPTIGQVLVIAGGETLLERWRRTGPKLQLPQQPKPPPPQDTEARAQGIVRILNFLLRNPSTPIMPEMKIRKIGAPKGSYGFEVEVENRPDILRHVLRYYITVGYDRNKVWIDEARDTFIIIA